MGGRFGFDFALDARDVSRGGISCDYTLYSDGSNEYFIPFVPCDQLYIGEEVHTVGGQNLIMGDFSL